jgi:hypothetical protein
MGRGARFALFLVLLIGFVILLAVTLSNHGQAACTGNPLNCPSGTGIAQDADGVARGIESVGTFLLGVSAFGAFILTLRAPKKAEDSRGPSKSSSNSG